MKKMFIAIVGLGLVAATITILDGFISDYKEPPQAEQSRLTSRIEEYKKKGYINKIQINRATNIAHLYLGKPYFDLLPSDQEEIAHDVYRNYKHNYPSLERVIIRDYKPDTSIKGIRDEDPIIGYCSESKFQINRKKP